MDSYLNAEMSAALQACDFDPTSTEAIKQILLRERTERNSLESNEAETIAQYDRILAACIEKEKA